MMKENEKILTAVDSALKEYDSSVVSVDLNDENMIDVDLCGQHWNNTYFSSVARYEKCDILELQKELDKRNVRHCL